MFSCCIDGEALTGKWKVEIHKWDGLVIQMLCNILDECMEELMCCESAQRDKKRKIRK